MPPTYTPHPGWAAQVAQSVERQRNAEAARAAVTYVNTPPPQYTPADTPCLSPDRREMSEGARIGAAISAARRLYPAAVADCLVDTLSWHQSTTSRVSATSLPARLVDELLRPPT